MEGMKFVRSTLLVRWDRISLQGSKSRYGTEVKSVKRSARNQILLLTIQR
jgi:hypothetical protein